MDIHNKNRFPRRLFTYSGRIGRLTYLVDSLVVPFCLAILPLILFFPTSFFSLIISRENSDLFAASIAGMGLLVIFYEILIIPVCIVISLFALFKRLHDFNVSGVVGLVLVFAPLLVSMLLSPFLVIIPPLLAIYKVVLLLYLLLKPGTPGTNDYGPSPRQPMVSPTPSVVPPAAPVQSVHPAEPAVPEVQEDPKV